MLESSSLPRTPIVPLAEVNTYGDRKRLEFMLAVLERYAREAQPDAISVLDFGCGTGERLGLILAARGYEIVGVDIDEASIAHAERRRTDLGLNNARFFSGSLEDFRSAASSHTFDVMVCSEVLEHLDDPHSTLRLLSTFLRDDGLLVVTIPNGFGPFEFEVLVWGLLEKLGVIPLLRFAKGCLFGRRSIARGDPGTCAENSPHVQFFSLRGVHRCLTAAGFVVVEAQNRTFLCGPFTDYLHSLFSDTQLGKWFLQWNSVVADRLPRCIVSGWMLVAKPTGRGVATAFPEGGVSSASIWRQLKRWANRR